MFLTLSLTLALGGVKDGLRQRARQFEECLAVCTGISLSWREAPQTLIEKHHLEQRVVTRQEGADREIQFLYRDPQAQLPVWIDGQLTIVAWGNRNDKNSKLPRTGWARQESIEAGKWRWLSPQAVEIPASLGLEKGVWFQIKEGIQGILVHDEQELPHVYMMTEAASHYYNIMTRHQRMPVLIGEKI